MSLPQIAGHDLQDLIGKGSCGAVYRAAAVDTRTSCAVKVFSSMAINRKLLSIGMRGLQHLPEHPGILRPITFDFDNSPYFIALPLIGFMAEDGKGRKTWETPTLESSCGKVPPDEAWRYIYEVCDTMSWLHKHNLVHCNLKPRNVLIEDDPNSATKIVDPVQGWISGVHHFEVTDHFFYVAPEQADHPENLATQGTSWDVYSFGVLAYRLLTGRFPRAQEAWEERSRQQSSRSGVPHVTDSAKLLQMISSHPEITWPAKPSSKWDERRKQIIERCLDLDPRRRWSDLREVMQQFEKLEADFQIEDAHDRIEIEKRRQARKVAMLRFASITLALLLIVASTAALYWLFLHQNGVRTFAEKEQHYKQHIQEREDYFKQTLDEEKGNIIFLNDQLRTAKEHKRLADANLQISQDAVDQFLNQLLQIPAGIGVEAEISEKQINDALSFYDRERPNLERNDDLVPERAHNYFNTAQLLLRKNRRPEALDYLEKARVFMVKLLQNPSAHVDRTGCETLLGRCCRSLGTLRAEDGRRKEALDLLTESVAALAEAVKASPKSRTIRVECASAWYELGKRARRDRQLQIASNALEQVPPLLDSMALGDTPNLQEQFLLARNHLERGLTLRDMGQVDNAIQSILDSIEMMVKLVERARPDNQEIALTLAEAYVEDGETVFGKLGPTHAAEAHGEAVNILIELVRQYPGWAEPRYLLARCYADLALLEKDRNQSAEALRRQGLALDTLNQLTKTQATAPRFIYELARQKGQNAQLLSDSGRTKDALTQCKDAVSQMEAMMAANDRTLDDLDRKAYGVRLATLYGVLGHIGEVSHDNKLARTSFSKASEIWEKLKVTCGEDAVILQGLNFSKNRLAKLK